MKVGTGRDKCPVVIKISFYPLSNKSPVIYLFGGNSCKSKNRSPPSKKNPTQHASHLRTKGIWKNTFINVNESTQGYLHRVHTGEFGSNVNFPT